MIDRKRILEQIQTARDEQVYLCGKIADLTGNPILPVTKVAKQRRPPKIETLLRDLRALEEMNTWLHSEWVRLRSNDLDVNQSDIRRLVDQGIVVLPQKPSRRGRGRPSKPGRESQLKFWTDLLRAHGRNLDDALLMANEILASRPKLRKDGKTDVNYAHDLDTLKTSVKRAKKRARISRI